VTEKKTAHMARTTGKLKRHNNTWFLSTPPPNVRQFLDYDYLGSLTAEEKLWLSDFSQAYYQASGPQGKELAPLELKAANDRNNARRRDAYNHSVMLPLWLAEKTPTSTTTAAEDDK